MTCFALAGFGAGFPGRYVSMASATCSGVAVPYWALKGRRRVRRFGSVSVGFFVRRIGDRRFNEKD